MIDARRQYELAMKLWSTSISQGHAIKSEENGWIRTYWLVYAAMFAFGATFRATGVAVVGPRVSAGTLAIMVVAASLFFTCWAMSQMLALRWTYFGVRDRLLRALKWLRLDDASAWPNGYSLQPAGSIRLLSEIIDGKTWRKITKPFDTFLQRLITLVFAHCLVTMAWLLVATGLSTATWLAILSITVLSPLLWLAWVLRRDFVHFRRR